MINNYLFHGLSVFIKSVGFAIHLFKLSHKKGNLLFNSLSRQLDFHQA